MRRRVAMIITAVVALGVMLPGVARAEPPSNDDFDSAVVVPALPFVTQVDTREATRATDDPYWCQITSAGTVWFSYTPTEDLLLRATTVGSDHHTILSANTGTRGELSNVPEACDAGGSSFGATVTFRATAGTTYHFMVTRDYGAGGTASFGLQAVTPAPNDNFVDAEPIATLPDTRAIDLSVASVEYDEPADSPGCFSSATRSVWYTFTPAETNSFVARIDDYQAEVSVYTGSTLPDLSPIACANGGFSDRALFRATAGTTYHLRVSGPTTLDQTTLSLAEAPPLQPYYSISPSDPTIYELTHFHGETGEFGTPVASGEWDFGDGTVAPADGSGVSHHYTADGTYQVRLSVVSPDGRTATRTGTVTVTTHDVSVSRFSVPGKARVGDTKQITVNVANTRYREPVTTDLYKSDGSGWELVGTLTIDVPAHPTNTVRFPFAYTFTAEDAVAGKVAFRTVVRLPSGVRDARAFDNELISTATTVLPGSTDGPA